jgi:uncharacterized OB-fold protein
MEIITEVVPNYSNQRIKKGWKCPDCNIVVNPEKETCPNCSKKINKESIKDKRDLLLG